MITGLVLVTMRASPRAALSVPSVTRNEGIANRVVRRPLTRPTRAPVPIPAAAPTSQLFATCAMARPAAIPDSARFEPTERSICRAMITKVIPIAMIDTRAVCRPMLRKLSIDRNQGDERLKTTSRTAKAT